MISITQILKSNLRKKAGFGMSPVMADLTVKSPLSSSFTSNTPSIDPTNNSNDNIGQNVWNAGMNIGNNTLGSAVVTGGAAALPALSASSWNPSTLGNIAKDVGTSLTRGGLGGLVAGATQNALPVVEKGIENSIGYNPNDSVLSNAYNGIQNPSSLYLSQKPDQQPGSPTRTWGNWLDQSLTSGGGLKGALNNGVAGAAGGLATGGGLPAAVAGAVGNAGLTIPSNIYSVGKGLWNLASQLHQNAAQSSEEGAMIRAVDKRQAYQQEHNIPMHNPSPEELASYHLNKQSIENIVDRYFPL